MIGVHPLSRVAVEARQHLAAMNCKWCAKCQRVRHREDFSACVTKADGLQVHCSECQSRATSAWGKANRARATEAHRNWVELNRERHSAYMAAYRKRPDRLAKHAARAAASRATVAGRLRNRTATRVNAVLKGAKGGARTEALLGWTFAELRQHLERQFLKGMGWHNVGEWHIDHITPLASFTITGADDPELRRAWALPNLRPLWAADNIRKGAKREVLL